MNSDRKILAIGLMALSAVGCLSRQGTEPPTFPEGGLVALSKAPPNPWSLENALEGVYDTTSRFGNTVIVHASQWGGVNVGSGMQSTVAILAGDRAGFALMQPGCFTDNSSKTPVTRLVLEGYWRYLDESEPNPNNNGLIRLFVSPQEIVDYVCNAPAWVADGGAPGAARPPPGDPRPRPSVRATLSGSTGNGVSSPGTPITVNWVKERKSKKNANGQQTFFVGVHHGGCQTAQNCGISENTPETSILATKLGGDYLEIDVHLTKDGIPVFFHLSLLPVDVQGAYCFGNIEDYTYDELLANCRLRNGEVIPRVYDMLNYVYTRTSFPTYLDSKTTDVIVPVSNILAQLQNELVPCNPPPPEVTPGTPWPPAGKRCLYPGSRPVWERGVIGLPSSDFVTTYQQALAAGQLAPSQKCLIEEAISDVIATPCVAWMPRYTRGPMTDDVRNLQMQGIFVGFWTINDPATMDAFLTTAVPNGFLTNFLGLANQRFEVVGTPPTFVPYKVTVP